MRDDYEVHWRRQVSPDLSAHIIRRNSATFHVEEEVDL